MNFCWKLTSMLAKKQLKQILEKVINTHGATQTAEVLDDVKAIRLQVLHKSSHDSMPFPI